MNKAGAKPADLSRQHGISETTLYYWRSRYGGLEVSDAKWLQALDEESRKLRTLRAEIILPSRTVPKRCREHVALTPWPAAAPKIAEMCIG